MLCPFFNLGSIWGWVVNARPLPLYSLDAEEVPISPTAAWASRPVWRGTENLALTGCELWTIQPVASCYTDYAMPISRTPNTEFS
jgi:hypothetical protein